MNIWTSESSLQIRGHPSTANESGIGCSASCTLGDCVTSRPEGHSQPKELWFLIYSWICICTEYTGEYYLSFHLVPSSSFHPVIHNIPRLLPDVTPTLGPCGWWYMHEHVHTCTVQSVSGVMRRYVLIIRTCLCMYMYMYSRSLTGFWWHIRSDTENCEGWLSPGGHSSGGRALTA